MVKKCSTIKYNKDTDERYQAKFNTMDCINVGSLFDVLKWWKEEGQRSFPKMVLAAMTFLGKPYHNAMKKEYSVLEHG